MKAPQYIIKDIENGYIIKWRTTNKIILFDSQEEAEKYIDRFTCGNHEICKGIYFLHDSINYKDIVKKELKELEED